MDDNGEVKRSKGGQFLPGQRGISPGRPKVFADHRELCQRFMNEEGWAILQTIARDPKAKDRFKAAELIAAYAVGKPPALIAGDPEGAPINITLSDTDLRSLADWALGSTE